MTEHIHVIANDDGGSVVAETETVGAAENVILGCLLDRADVIYPLTLAEYIADALRGAGLLSDAPADRASNPAEAVDVPPVPTRERTRS